MPTILVTGGTGYIGSHLCVELLNAGYKVVVLDNLSNSSIGVVQRIERLAGRPIALHIGDVRDAEALNEVFRLHSVDAIVHLAGLKAVGESVARPLNYFDNNVTGLICLLEAAERSGVRRLVFSSSATVYGNPSAAVPIVETATTEPTSPYARSKLIAEQIIGDLCASNSEWSTVILRYFNPAGAHVSGQIGEDPRGVPNNLLPFVAQVAVGRHPKLVVFGNDYPTRDGTGIRDYIHVVDLARGHLAALDRVLRSQQRLTVNLGTGQGYSVLEVVRAFETASNHSIPYSFAPRRPGDVPTYVADARMAWEVLGWRPQFGLKDVCEHHWNWQRKNPCGYSELSDCP